MNTDLGWTVRRADAGNERESAGHYLKVNFKRTRICGLVAFCAILQCEIRHKV